jgi:methylthioribose-1-phosphate isomerase
MRRGRLRLIDQTLLPSTYEVISLGSVEAVCEAIRALRVRGAPALGVTGAYGLLVAIEERWGEGGHFFDVVIDEGDDADVRIDEFPDAVSVDELRAHLVRAAETLGETRPTAVNLKWAIRRMASVYGARHDDARALARALLDEAVRIHTEDIEMCRRLGAHGAELIADGDRVVTHCNTGGLATGGYGTALGVVFSAFEARKRVHVYADETRPLLQGARLTAWECERVGVPVTVLVDGAAASLLSTGRIACAITGADRIAANGDAANKIGTLALAIAARRYEVPFYVAAPSSTIDPGLAHGGLIPIEQRDADEVRRFSGAAAAPEAVDAYNPAFDVTPSELVSAIITETGVHRPPFHFSRR